MIQATRRRREKTARQNGRPDFPIPEERGMRR